MKSRITTFILICLAIIIAIPETGHAAGLGTKLKGKLLLQVEQGGRIWYVAPKDELRYEVTFDNALTLFQQHAVGIKNIDLNKIPIEPLSLSDTNDSDKDGFNDRYEANAGFNPFGAGKLTPSIVFGKKQSGKLLLQVEQGGRIWYVDFNGKRWEVTWANLLTLFKKLSIGITNADLNKIPMEENLENQITDSNTTSSSTSSNTQSRQTKNPPEQKNTKTTIAQKPALLQILVDFDSLSGAQLAQLYGTLNSNDLIWLQMKDAFGNILHFKICQDLPNFIHNSTMYGARTCNDTIRGYQEAFALGSTMETVLAYADRQRMEILNTYNCTTGGVDATTCNMYRGATQNINNMMNETNKQIINNMGTKCLVNIDPECQPYNPF